MFEIYTKGRHFFPLYGAILFKMLQFIILDSKLHSIKWDHTAPEVGDDYPSSEENEALCCAIKTWSRWVKQSANNYP